MGFSFELNKNLRQELSLTKMIQFGPYGGSFMTSNQKDCSTQYYVSTIDHFLLNVVRNTCPFITTQWLSDRMFHCFNLNCYQQFGTEHGLRLHRLWRSPPCQEYMSRARKIDVSVETVSMSFLIGFGVQCTLLDFDMNTNAPSYLPYEDFQCYGANTINNLTNKDPRIDV